MARMAVMVLFLDAFIPMILQAEEILKVDEIDSSTVEVGAYVVIIYGEGERHPISGKWERMATVRGYIKAIDLERLTIGIHSWKTEIERDQIHKLVIAMSERERTEKLRSLRARYRPNLTLEADYLGGVDKANTGYFIFGERHQKALPWSASVYFGDFFSSERRSRIGLRYAYRKVHIFPESPDREHVNPYPPSAAELRRRVEGITGQLVSLLLVTQYVLYKSKYAAVMADLAFGLSFEKYYYIRGADPFGPEATRPQGSVGATLLVPIHPHIGVQATARADLFWEYLGNYFVQGKSVAVGPFLRF